ncbi:hypothetical protein HNY73_007098 [Argiope bruennichi]|uniref:Uncharacterized protein n=1 Tax=Argiope bruennichi TaxID=94029 RepID=A0A8T0FFY1_ARGBR|nr:hypothetical protein HNY73_007098 [Argiope bruennichi]
MTHLGSCVPSRAWSVIHPTTHSRNVVGEASLWLTCTALATVWRGGPLTTLSEKRFRPSLLHLHLPALPRLARVAEKTDPTWSTAWADPPHFSYLPATGLTHLAQWKHYSFNSRTREKVLLEVFEQPSTPALQVYMKDIASIFTAKRCLSLSLSVPSPGF